MSRDLAFQRQIGEKLISVTVRIDYPHGSFDLTFPADSFPTEEPGINELRAKIIQFADDLKLSALTQIHTPKPNQT